MSHGAVEWHQHKDAYLAVVLDGEYDEVGDHGRFRLSAGDAFVHVPFERHSDVINRGGALVANIPISFRDALTLQSGRVADPKEFVRDIVNGAPLTISTTEPTTRFIGDEIDQLAETILAPGKLVADDGLENARLSPRSLRRHFLRRSGLSASKFQVRCRALCAMREIAADSTPFSELAAALGYADQAHMTRAIVELTRHPPSYWRRAAYVEDGYPVL